MLKLPLRLARPFYQKVFYYFKKIGERNNHLTLDIPLDCLNPERRDVCIHYRFLEPSSRQFNFTEYSDNFGKTGTKSAIKCKNRARFFIPVDLVQNH